MSIRIHHKHGHIINIPYSAMRVRMSNAVDAAMRRLTTKYRKERRMSKRLNVLEYGADPSGTKDSTVAFRKMLEEGAPHMIVPAGVYRLSGAIKGSVEVAAPALTDEVRVEAAPPEEEPS